MSKVDGVDWSEELADEMKERYKKWKEDVKGRGVNPEDREKIVKVYRETRLLLQNYRHANSIAKFLGDRLEEACHSLSGKMTVETYQSKYRNRGEGGERDGRG